MNIFRPIISSSIRLLVTNNARISLAILCPTQTQSQIHSKINFFSTTISSTSYQKNKNSIKMANNGEEGLSLNDPNSFSNPVEAKTEKLHLNWNVNFDRKVLEGSISCVISKIPTAEQIIFDTRDLKIQSVNLTENGKVKFPLKFELGQAVGTFGKPLTVYFESSNDCCKCPSFKSNSSEKNLEITIKYETDPKSSALLWLEKEQTSGKEFPYVFSHSEAIHSRALFPCQDTPSVKTTYTAEVKAPKDLTVLMSGVRSRENPFSVPDNKTINLFKFEQIIPVPAYLIAIVVGKLEGERIGPRSMVWSEEAYVKAAAYDFSEAEEMIKTAEDLMGEYVWGDYDILVLPPSFPFGGMENPCLTFATPTLLAGDKSLANVIAHEIAHSWTGNLVTNRTFEHFWLNEGFTVFLERKIIGRMRGEKMRQFQSIGGWKELKDTILRDLGETNPFTRLVIDLRGVDPDDSFSTVPYEKGYAFLYYLEEKVGGPAIFEPFFKSYVQKYKKQSITTNMFIDFFIGYFTAQGLAKEIADIPWDDWLYKTGMPPYTPKYDTSYVDVCTDLKNKWDAWNPETEPNCPFSNDDLKKFKIASEQMIEFLSQILDDERNFPVAKAKAMESAYNLNAMNNSEIRYRWLRLCIKARWEEQVKRALQLVTEQGRMKFIRPIYRELYAWEEVRALTIETFKRNQPNMMYVSAYTVAKDLNLNMTQVTEI